MAGIFDWLFKKQTGADQQKLEGGTAKNALTMGDSGGSDGSPGADETSGQLANAFLGGAAAFLMTKPTANTTGMSVTDKYKNRLQMGNAGIQGAEKFMSTLGPWGQAAAMGTQLVDMGVQQFQKKINFTGNTTVQKTGGFGNMNEVVEQKKQAREASGLANIFGGQSAKSLQNEADQVTKMNEQASTLINDQSRKMAGAGTMSGILAAQNNIRLKGFGRPVTVGKNGISTSFLIEFKKFRELREIPTLLNGGLIQSPINVIVDGKLHKELHHMKDLVNTDITTKGIPVITKEMEDGGEIRQAAELERDEIIFHYELTKKLEALEKDGSDAAMIEAGKILVKEILKNTKDSKSKLLKTVE